MPESLLPLNSTIHVHFWIFFCPGRKLNTFLKWNTESLLQRIQINLSLTFTIPHQAWHQGRQWLCPGISTACIRPQNNCVTKPEKTVSDRGSFYLSHMKNSFVIPFPLQAGFGCVSQRKVSHQKLALFQSFFRLNGK